MHITSYLEKVSMSHHLQECLLNLMTMVNFALMPWVHKSFAVISAWSMVCRYSSNVTIRNESFFFFNSQGTDAKVTIVFMLLINESLTMVSLKSTLISFTYDSLELLSPYRQPWSNQQWWLSIVAQDRCIDVMPCTVIMSSTTNDSPLTLFFLCAVYEEVYIMHHRIPP